MSDPGYDFFAIGPRPTAGTAPHPPVPAPGHGVAGTPVVNQFGTPVNPAMDGFASPAPPTPFPAAPGSGYHGQVNQFGTPLDVQPTATGPYAAPGIASQPVGAPGLVTTWDASHAWSGRAAGRRAAAAQARPGTVLAAGVLAIVNGAVGLLGGVVTLLAMSALTSVAAGSGVSVSSRTTATIDAILFLVLALSAAWLVAGIGAVRGHRGSVKALRVLTLLGTLLAVVSLALAMSAENPQVSNFLTLAMDMVLIYLVWNRKASEWLAAA